MAVFDDLDDFNPQDQDILKKLSQSGAMLSFEEVQAGVRGDNPFDYSAPFSANDGTSNLPYVDKYVSQNVVSLAFSGIDARYIERNYFVNAKDTTEKNIKVVKELECETDIIPKEFNLYVNRDGVEGYQAGGEDEYIAKIFVYISKNGNKLSHLYQCSENGIKEDEIFFFLEDNTGDYSNQVLYARFGSEKVKSRLLKASGQSLSNISSLVPDFNNDLLKELIRNGKIEAKSPILAAVLKGSLWIGVVAYAIPKAVGWVITQIGNIIEENLKIPEKIWDSHSDDYFLDKHNLIRELQINTEFLDTIDSILKKDNPFIQIIITPFGKRIVETNVQFVKHLVNQYNTYVEKFVDEVYDRYQRIVKASDFIFNHSEAFAFFCGLWNGLVDFIADIFKFVGVILETPFDLINNFQYFLESLDNFLDALKNFSIVDVFMSITFVQAYVLNELIKFFKSDNIREEYNLDKIAYYTGYGVGFILSLFIPFLDLANIAKVGNVTKVTRAVPDEYLKAIASKSGEVPKKSGQLIKLLDDLAEFLGKKAKGKSFNDEIKKVLDDAVEYIKRNADDFKKPVKDLKQIQKMWDNFTYKDLMKIPPNKKPCFLAGTLVKSENGLVPIEDIVTGQKVYAYNFENKKSELKTVTQTYRNITEKYVCINAVNGTIKATGQHRFWIPEENKWIMANSLKTGMNFLNSEGNQVAVISLEIKEETVKTYNLEVEDHHNYYVGKDEILTHNKTRTSIFASTELIEIEFYRHFIGNEDLYVGQTQQGIGTRYEQHNRDFKRNPSKKPWMAKKPDLGYIRINGSAGPFKMTPYEAAVVELYEMNSRGGVRKGSKGLYNKKKPIGKKKFEQFKKLGTFNPCKFYA